MAQTTNNYPNGIPIYVVDAFTKENFAGNPAAVCLLNSDTVSLRLFAGILPYLRSLDGSDSQNPLGMNS